MSFSESAGTSLLPTLSRIVLCAAFASVGYNKLFTDATFTSEEATVLRDVYGVDVTPSPEIVTPIEATDIDPTAARPARIQPVSLQVADPQDPDPNQPQEVETPVEEPLAAPQTEEPPPAQAETPPAPPITPAAPAPAGSQRSMHKITLLLHNNGLPYPLYGAWVLALTELVGGCLLLLGFFSRIWGLGLAIAMGVAFYIVTIGYNGFITQTLNPIEFARDTAAFNTMFSQLGLGLLALGIFLTGPGPISFDRIFFGRHRGGGSEDGDD